MSDNTIKLLRSGKINNRLLCELAGHEGFRRLMVDMEIYVDRIANMRIHDLNALLAAERKTVMEKMKLDGCDVNMRALELAQIDGDEYFAHVIYDDLRPNLRAIREAHKTDTTTADTESPAEDAIKQIEAVVGGEGSAQEKQVRLLLAQLGIDYDALTPDEFVTLMGIIDKSKLLRSSASKRGKAIGPTTHGYGKRRKK
ncbi:MAG: XRE family transcriptional regulator [Clostridium lundense]|nr:XRE family transcriptional regulator [Clostridium lundense]